MATPEQVAAFRAANTGLTVKVQADLAAFWSRLNTSRVDASTKALLDYVPLLTQRYGEIAATIAADWYQLLRPGASYRALTAAPVAAEVVRKSVESAAVYLWTPTPERALRALQGATSRHVLQAGRDTITVNASKDKGALGWERVTAAGGCDWCQAHAGHVNSEAAASFEAHDHDHCVGVPEFG